MFMGHWLVTILLFHPTMLQLGWKQSASSQPYHEQDRPAILVPLSLRSGAVACNISILKQIKS